MQEYYPLLSARIQSTFIDLLVVIALMCAITGVMDHVQHVPDWVTMLLISCLIAYEPVCTSLGCTLGNFVKGIRVRQADDSSKRINLFQAIIRFIVKLALGWISFLTIHSNQKRRAIHDMAAGSVMVRK